MEHAAGIAVDPRDIAAIVDSTSIGAGGARIIDRGEPARSQLEGMGHAGERIESSNIAALVDRPGQRRGSAREVNRSVSAALPKSGRCDAQREAECKQEILHLSLHWFFPFVRT